MTVAEMPAVEHEHWGITFTLQRVDEEVRIETDGYSSAIAVVDDQKMTASDLADQDAVNAACETYCLASGIVPTDEDEDEDLAIVP